MSRIVLTSDLLRQLRSELLQSHRETCAALFGRAVVRKGRLVRLVVRDVQWMTATEYLERSEVAAQLRPEVVSAVTQRARRNSESLVFVHSHPFALNEFSPTDDAGEQRLREFLARRTPGVMHASLLVTPEVTIARVLGSHEALAVVGVGPELVWGKPACSGHDQQSFDRQIRVFGAAGQDRLREMRVGIVGLGGTGSVVLEQLAHLGVRRFLLIDADVVEATNLNRLVGATPRSVGRPKVNVARAYAKRINPNAEVVARRGSVLVAKVAEELADTDFVFCCTDSHGSRAVLNQLAYQYLVPTIDMGVAIGAPDGQIAHITGRTQMLGPSLGCLVCGDKLDPERVRVDLLSEFERAADPYVVGVREPAPAVISLNATVSSMATTMFLGAAVGIPSSARMIHYDGMTGRVRATVSNRHPKCVVCSLRGALARANEWPLPARQA